MISFHNDYSVPPILCELLYGIIPDDWHIPLVFLSGTRIKDHTGNRTLGSYFPQEPRHIEIYLDAIFETALRWGRIEIGGPSFRIWYELLHVCLHEFGHAGDAYLQGLPDAAYEAGGYEWDNAEEIANGYADLMMWRLVDWDKRLLQPRWLRHLSVRLERRLGSAMRGRWTALSRQWLAEYRCWKSGGQLTAGDVASLFWVHRGEYIVPFSDNALIRRVAADLAYKYKDGAGRRYILFDYGDIPEIARRIQSPLAHVPAVSDTGFANSRQGQARLPRQMCLELFPQRKARIKRSHADEQFEDA